MVYLLPLEQEDCDVNIRENDDVCNMVCVLRMNYPIRQKDTFF